MGRKDPNLAPAFNTFSQCSFYLNCLGPGHTSYFKKMSQDPRISKFLQEYDLKTKQADRILSIGVDVF